MGLIPHSTGGGDFLLRVKPMYADTDVAVCAQMAGNSPGSLSLASYVATATATATDGTVKRVEATGTANHLPAIFDNTFYSGGNVAK